MAKSIPRRMPLEQLDAWGAVSTFTCLPVLLSQRDTGAQSSHLLALAQRWQPGTAAPVDHRCQQMPYTQPQVPSWTGSAPAVMAGCSCQGAEWHWGVFPGSGRDGASLVLVCVMLLAWPGCCSLGQPGQACACWATTWLLDVAGSSLVSLWPPRAGMCSEGCWLLLCGRLNWTEATG